MLYKLYKTVVAFLELIVDLVEHIIPQIKRWRNADRKYRKSRDKIGEFLNKDQRNLDAIMGFHEALIDYNLWEFRLFSEQSKVLFWIGLFLALYWGRFFGILIITSIIFVTLVILYYFKKERY